MARWFLLRGRLRELDTLDRGQAGWRRVLSSRQASDGRACGSGPRRAVCASRVINGRVGKPVVPGALLDVGGATACSSCLHHQPCEKNCHRLDSWLAEADTAIRGRWRSAQCEGSVARRRFAGCESAGSGRPS